MATVTKPIALDESLNTTEVTPRNIADVLAQELEGIAQALTPVQPSASGVSYDNTASGLAADDVQDAIDELADEKANTADLAAVATSGSYNDLTNKPTIPTVNDGTLTIQKNGVNVQTFSANSSANKTANIPSDTTETTDTEPYVLRQGKGDLVDTEIVGASVAWNQLVQNGNFADTSGWVATRCSLSVSSNVATVTCNSDGWFRLEQAFPAERRYQNGHKYIFSCDVKFSENSSTKKYALGLNPSPYSLYNTTTSWQTIQMVLTMGSTTTGLWVGVTNGVSGDTLYVKNVISIDLTASLGTTIADYIYSLEQNNAGDGVSWFRKYFPNAYYAYDAGSIQSVNVSGRKVVGKNLLIGTELGNWNKALQEKTVSTTRARCKELINITPLTQYTVSATALGGKTMQCAVIQYSGGSGTDVSDSGWNNLPYSFVSKDTAKIMYVTFKTADSAEHPENYFENAQLELGSTATSYEPYTTTTYPLDSSKELRGIPKLVDGKLKYDGDVYTSGGSITRKYGIVDLGTLNWGGTTPSYYSDDLTSVIKKPTTNNDAINAICSIYPLASRYNMFDKCVACDTSGRIYGRDATYNDYTAFKTAMSGVYLVYELATPTTESADAYQNPQRAYPDGTEEFIDYGVSQSTRDVAIPVGNNSDYTINEVIEPIADYVDNIPIMCKETTPGTYTLTATVDANGNVTYAWA